MLQQTQVPRVAQAWDGFMARFPDVEAAAARGSGRADRRVGAARLPAARAPTLGDRDRRARARLARRPHRAPGHRALHRGRDRGRGRRAPTPSRSTRTSAGSSSACDGRVARRRARPTRRMRALGGRLRGRDRLLALMDLGALVCAPRASGVRGVPAPARAARRADRSTVNAARARPVSRDRSANGAGTVLAALRNAPTPVAAARRRRARVARDRRPRRKCTAPSAALAADARRRELAVAARRRRCRREEVAQQIVPAGREDRLGMELHAFDRQLAVAERP